MADNKSDDNTPNTTLKLDSSLIESQTTPTKGDALEIHTTPRITYTHILGVIIIGLVVYLLYYSYSCFYENQDLNNEPFIEKTVKTGIDDDQVFDVDSEVNKLRQLQEKYLVSLNAKRNS